MFLWFLSFLNVVALCLAQLNIAHDQGMMVHEIVSIIVTKNQNFYPSEKYFDAEVQFEAFNKIFHLLLYEDLKFRDMEIESFQPSTQIRANSTFYEGILRNKTFDSSVSGYFHKGTFCGTVTEHKTMYFLEPASVVFPNDSSRSEKMVVYRSEDSVEWEEADMKKASKDRDVMRDEFSKGWNRNGMNFENISSQRNEIPLFWMKIPHAPKYFSYLNRVVNKSGDTDRACQIEMVADHTLYEYFNKDVDDVSGFLYLHAKYTDSIFRKTDFDGDGLPDNIRIVAKKITVYKSVDDPEYTLARVKDLHELLLKFSMRIQRHCLSICISNRWVRELVNI
ncbi:disintegrin and metalloproteinase domain-containing protein 10 [Caerostris extrusa]|uniref:Disintegrin and metalloproteinase domain-containing protein 10 n=1 Tax=Caerostris extrusa TaxID=172846 RepID=A0AAV4WN37_CAEEX|nr:disintegrin and metalloproteinase domain-containing protein 10 [Caerostris extrusa]